MVTGSTRGRAAPPPDDGGAAVLPGQPLQAESSRSADRSARKGAVRIGAAEHAMAEGPGSTTFVRQVTPDEDGRAGFPGVPEGGSG